MSLKRLLIKALFFIAFLVIPVPANGTTYIVFRYDDLSADRPGVREANALRRQIWEAEQKLDALFQKYDIPYVIAIIPCASSEYGGVASAGEKVSFGEDKEKTEFIKRAVLVGRAEVAQHGLSHTNFAGQNHRPGEFRERDYASQLRAIAKGREILLHACELSEISTFVPPWNAWTYDTTKILKELGFKILSADRYYYYKSARELIHIPFTAVPQELELMVDQKLLLEEGIIVVLYHPFEIVKFPGSASSFFGVERFEKLLQELSTMPEVKVVTLQQLANEVEDLTTERYRSANDLWRQRSFWAKLLPRHLWPGTNKQEVYLGLDEYLQELRYWKVATAGLIAALLMMGLLARYLISLRLAAKWRFRIDILATLLFCLSIIAELRLVQRGYHVTGLRAVPLFFSTSFVMALGSRIIKKAEPLGKPLPNLNT